MTNVKQKIMLPFSVAVSYMNGRADGAVRISSNPNIIKWKIKWKKNEKYNDSLNYWINLIFRLIMLLQY